MGSSSGLLALPCLSTYAASKFALEAITDSLRVELSPFGISVTIIEAGNVETPIWGKGVAVTNKIAADTRPEILRLYQPLIEFSKHIALNSPKLPADKGGQSRKQGITHTKAKRVLYNWYRRSIV